MIKKYLSLSLIILTVALLFISAHINVRLYRQVHSYNLLLNETFLDPLGLRIFSAEENQAILRDKNPRVIFLGDSRAASWPAPAQVNGVAFFNRGVAAQTSAQVLGRLEEDALALKPDVLVLQVGINDLKTIPLFPEKKDRIVAECKANIQRIVERSVKNHTRIIVTTVFPFAETPMTRRLSWPDDVALAVAEVNAFIVTLSGKHVYILDAAKQVGNKQQVVDPLYSYDFYHLNRTGYAELNKELAPLLQHLKKP